MKTAPPRKPPAPAATIPYVVLASKGGPYDDDAYRAGFEAGRIDAFLANMRSLGGPHVFAETVTDANVPQLEAIANYHGFTTQAGDPTDGRVRLKFTQTADIR